MTTMHERLRRARENAGIKSAAQAAARLGLSASAYRAHENGQNRYDDAAALRYAHAFGVSAEWLYYGQDLDYDEWRDRQSDGRDANSSERFENADKASPDRIPEIDPRARLTEDPHAATFEASQDSTAAPDTGFAGDHWHLPARLLAGFGLSSSQIAAVVVQGDAMAPTLIDGDVVFIDTTHRMPSPDGLYAIVDRLGGVVVKRLTLHHGSIRVSSDNKNHSISDFADHEFKIVGRYIGRFTV